MELNVTEKKKNRLVFEIKGEDHTLCNALKDELAADSDVKLVGYNVEHPEIGIPVFVLETKSKEAKDVLVDAIHRLKKKNDSFLKAFKKA